MFQLTFFVLIWSFTYYGSLPDCWIKSDSHLYYEAKYFWFLLSFLFPMYFRDLKMKQNKMNKLVWGSSTFSFFLVWIDFIQSNDPTKICQELENEKGKT